MRSTSEDDLLFPSILDLPEDVLGGTISPVIDEGQIFSFSSNSAALMLTFVVDPQLITSID